MPLSDTKNYGTDADGSPNQDYCHYCFKNGMFTGDHTVEQMVERCIPLMLHEMSEEDARTKLEKQLPALKRWGTPDA
jgi:hypothetical protein